MAVRTLQRHRAIRKTERVASQVVLTQELNAFGDATSCLLSATEQFSSRPPVHDQSVVALPKPHPLSIEPVPVSNKERLQQKGQLAVRCVTKHLHVKLEPAQKRLILLS